MRVLVATTPGVGHVLPLLPLAHELRDRGHELRWVGGPGGSDAVERAGFEVTVAAMPDATALQAELERLRPDLGSLSPAERRPVGFSTLFGRIAFPPIHDALRSVSATWAPDVMVHEAAALAAPLVAAAAGIPSVCHGFGEVVPEPAVRRAGEQLASRWRASGLEPDRYAGSYRGLYVDIYPPSLRSPDMDHVPDVQLCRPADGRPASGDLVYVSFGTIFNRSDVLLRMAVLAAAEVADEVLVTVGTDGDPTGLGTVPANVTVERFVPQAEVLPRCAAVVCHGGSGTLLAALAHGVPLLCLPQGADQFDNAANLVRRGAGVSLVGPAVTDAALRLALEQLLHEGGARAAAAELAEEIAAMPGTEEVARAVERLVPAP